MDHSVRRLEGYSVNINSRKDVPFKMKRLTSMIMALAMALTLAPVGIFAAEVITSFCQEK